MRGCLVRSEEMLKEVLVSCLSVHGRILDNFVAKKKKGTLINMLNQNHEVFRPFLPSHSGWLMTGKRSVK